MIESKLGYILKGREKMRPALVDKHGNEERDGSIYQLGEDEQALVAFDITNPMDNPKDGLEVDNRSGELVFCEDDEGEMKLTVNIDMSKIDKIRLPEKPSISKN